MTCKRHQRIIDSAYSVSRADMMRIRDIAVVEHGSCPLTLEHVELAFDAAGVDPSNRANLAFWRLAPIDDGRPLSSDNVMLVPRRGR